MENTVVYRLELANMPFDRWDESLWGFVHATGYRVKTADGHWYTEYEDDCFVDAPDCVYESEGDA